MTPAPSPLQATRPMHALVRGAGPTGALAALALADAGWSVTLVDPSTASQILGRSRAYAFTHSSRQLLQRLGLWESLLPVFEPFVRLDLEDLGARQSSRFGPSDLWGAPAAHEAAVGWIGEHNQLMEVLLSRVDAHPAIHTCLGSAAQRQAPAVATERTDWIIAADGALSPTREELGIGVWRHLYKQHCLTAQVRLRGAPAGTAWERLRPEGPFALLPMGEGRFQLVWSAPAWRCRQLESLPPAAFLDALAPVLPEGIDVDCLEEAARVFPVGLLLARRFHQSRTILVGETAHRCHPVGGQGLNLCWRDVAELHRLAQRARSGRLPLARLGSSYARHRWADVALTLLMTDGLVRMFSNRHPLLVAMRKVSLPLLEQLPWLRRCLLGVMSNGPCQPFGAPAT
ncbi:MAG: FAD-dependent monooxygenase [Cyanobacteriota bacterium]